MSSPTSEPETGSRTDEQTGRGLISPRAGLGVCRRCFDFIAKPEGLCRNCQQQPDDVAAVAPISYCVGGERLHREIAAYKRSADPSVPAATASLIQLLRGFVDQHLDCLATAAGVSAFDLVTTVPSGSASPARDNYHPLRHLVCSVPTLASRYRRVLYPGVHRGASRSYGPLRYFAFAELAGARALLIDDLWTTGSSAQSAAVALRAAGAEVVAMVVIGRHLNRGWAQNDLRLQRLKGNFSAGTCPLCASREKVPAAV